MTPDSDLIRFRPEEPVKPSPVRRPGDFWRVLIVDDVMSAGTAARETAPKASMRP